MLFRKQRLSALMLVCALGLAVLTISSCGKKMSSDTPLPTSYYPSVLMSSDNFVLYAIDPATGKKNWEFAMPIDATSIPTAWLYYKPSPLVYGDMVYQVAFNSDTIYKINAKTGALVTKMVLPGHYPMASPSHFFTSTATPIADNGIIYLATTNDTLYAIDTATAAIRWKFGAESPLFSSPVIYGNTIFIASSAGHVYALDKATGPDASGFPKWDWPGAGTPSTVTFVSSPCVSAPYLYIGGSNDSNLYCIYLDGTHVGPPDVGILRWTYKTNGNINSSPTAYGGVVLVGSNDFNLYCIDTQTATAKWKYRTRSQINSSPIISNQTVYIGSYDYDLYAVNIINGSHKWNFSSKGLIKSSPVPYKGSVYVGSYDGYLYAVDSATGVQKWNFKINGNIESSPAIDDYSGNQYNSGISGFNTSGNNN